MEGWGTSSEGQGVLGDPQVAPGSLHGSVLEHPEEEDICGGWWGGATQHLNHEEDVVCSLFADLATLQFRKPLQLLFLVKPGKGAGCPILPAGAEEGTMLSAHPGFSSQFNLFLLQ